MIDRSDMFERVHAIAVRIHLQPSARAQSFSASVSHDKPGSALPDMSLLGDLRDLDGGLWWWLDRAEAACGVVGDTTMERFHATITAASESSLGILHYFLTQTEEVLRIRWESGAHVALPPVSIADLRATKNRMLFHAGFGLRSSELEAKCRADGLVLSVEEIRNLRRAHGIDGRTGARKEKCPEAIVSRSFKDGCDICGVVDDLEVERGKPKAA